jgi:hypothetical protein
MNKRVMTSVCVAALCFIGATSGAMAGNTLFAKPDRLSHAPPVAPKTMTGITSHPVPAHPMCLPPTGRTSNADTFSNDPFNSVIQLNIGVGNAMTGASVEASVEAFAPSLLYNSMLHFSSTNPNDPNGIYMLFSPYFNPGVDQISSYGLQLLSDDSYPNIAAGADGILRIEWFDRNFDGLNTHLNPNAVWSDAARPIVCQGVYITCTDQPACDAAVAAAGGVLGGPPAPATLPITGKLAIGMLIVGLAMIVFRRRKLLLSGS